MSDIQGAAAKLAKTYEAFLYDRVAKRLTGRPVEIQWRQPYCDDFLGLAARDGNGGAIIQVAPDLDPDTKLKVFLHECAHVRDYKHLGSSKNHEQPPGSHYLPDRKGYLQINQDRENAVDSMAAYWLHFAELGAKSKTVISKLTSLLNWREINHG